MFNAIHTPLKHTTIFFTFILSLLSAPLCTAAEPNTKTIAITQIVSHPSLDKVRKGILDELAENGYTAGKSAQIIYENAQGSIVVASQIAQLFVAKKPDVIVAIATPSAQAAVNAAKKTTIPVVFATITDPIQAKLVTNLKHPGGNVTGSRNIPAFEKQLEQINQLLPQVKTIGIVLNYGEANSVQMLHSITEEAGHRHIKIKSIAAPTSAEVQTATQNLVKQVDAILLLQDNTVASALPALLKVANKNRLPVFSIFIEAVKAGALAGVAYDEYAIGKQTGKIVVQILQGKKAGDIAVTDPLHAESAINLNTAKLLNLNLTTDSLKQYSIVYPAK